MYAEYYYNAGATVTDVLSDLKAILTGTTDPNLLSASADKTNTTINTSINQAGWTLLEDQISSSSWFSLTAPVSDDTNQTKVVRLRFASPYLYLEVFETGGNGSYLNQAYYSNTYYYAQRLNLSSGGLIAITAAQTHIGLLSYSSSYGWGSSSYYSPTFASEYSRESVWDVAGTSPQVPFVWFNAGYSSAYSPKLIVPSSSSYSSYTGSYARFILCGRPDTYDLSATSDYLYNHYSGSPIVYDMSTYAKGYYTSSIYVYSNYNTYSRFYNLGGYISKKSDIWIFPANVGSPLDRVNMGTKTYVIWPFDSTRRLIVPEG